MFSIFSIEKALRIFKFMTIKKLSKIATKQAHYMTFFFILLAFNNTSITLMLNLSGKYIISLILF